MTMPIICLMGPTASGKTPLAVQLVQDFPCEIISVDSAMVYRGMNIGTAKPDAATLKLAPHWLIDIRNPQEAYSAGEFLRDAWQMIEEVIARSHIPLLVGGTMLYFRVLQQGLAALPVADETIRAELLQRATQVGWPALHAELACVDATAAQRIHPHDAQRIQRALEVYRVTGQTLTHLQQAAFPAVLGAHRMYSFALMVERAQLHVRIAERFDRMLAAGLIDEVKQLYERGDLHANLPAIRSVGYRQVWEYLAGQINETTMQETAIIATRQLAKRQMTWLRAWQDVTWLDATHDIPYQAMCQHMRAIL